MGDKYLYKFKCTWPKCGYEFETIIGAHISDKGGNSNVSTAVICPKCNNNLKHSEGKFIKKLGAKNGNK